MVLVAFELSDEPPHGEHHAHADEYGEGDAGPMHPSLLCRDAGAATPMRLLRRAGQSRVRRARQRRLYGVRAKGAGTSAARD